MAGRLATWLLLLAATLGRPAGASPDEPPTPRGDPGPPIPIFLNAPTDLDAFWKKLADPDFVILRGDLYRKLREASEAAGPSKAIPPGLVDSLEVSGAVSGDWARLVVECRIAAATDGPSWVPIHLDDLTLSEVRDASGDLPTRLSEGRAWQVELKGRGVHVVRVGLLAPVRSTAEGRRLELAVPLASSTRIDLVIPEDVLDASAGPDEPVGLATTPDRRGVRLFARLSPRARLDLAWRGRADPALKLPPLLSAQGEILLEVERGSIRSRSSWIVGSIRGTTGQVTLRLDPAEELLDLEVDGKAVQVEARAEGPRSVVAIPLAEPLRPGSTRALALNTRRAIASTGTVRVPLQGYSFDQAKVQTGVIAIARAGPLFLDPTPGRGLRRIDPRTELPESLRARADTTLAFEFDDQPFDLGLEVAPAPPRLRLAERTTVTLDPRSARIATRLDGRTSQGRVFEVKVDLPRGLDFEGAEPAEVVESARVVPLDPDAAPLPDAEAPRVATITLTPQARESDSFTLLLRGSAAIDPSRPVPLPVFRTRADSNEGPRYVLVSDRNVAVDLAEPDEGPSRLRADWGPPPADWPWPARRPAPDLGLLWLRGDSCPESIPLKVAVRPRTLRHDSTLAASIDRRGVDVVDEVAVEPAFGVASRLDISLPPSVPARWDVEGVDLAGREPLGADAASGRRYRLRFARDQADAFRLRFRYRLPFADAPDGDRGSSVRLDPIRVLEGNSTGRRVVIAAEPGLGLDPHAKGWEVATIADPAPPADGGPPARLALSSVEERPGPIDVEVKAGPRMPLPGVIVSRLWIRTVQRPEGDLATSARLWVESRDGSMSVSLPPGSSWVKAKVGPSDLPAGNVEPLAPDEYRLRFPTPAASGPVLVMIDFVVPAASTRGAWPTLGLLDGGVVQQTMWEAQIAGSRAGVGTPGGWADENEWFWAGGLWKRRPARTPPEVWHWLTGGNPRHRPSEAAETPESAGLQAYLFSRVGPPTPLRFPVLGRITLLLLCSGPALAAGLLVLARRPRPRPVAAGLLIIAFAAGLLFEPTVLILALQSSVLGVALWLAALAMHWAIEKGGHPRAGGEATPVVGPPSSGSAMARPALPAGSDGSTEIRARPVHPSSASTADHVVLIRAADRLADESLQQEAGRR